jgi:hypothetical protein
MTGTVLLIADVLLELKGIVLTGAIEATVVTEVMAFKNLYVALLRITLEQSSWVDLLSSQK